MSAHTAGPWQVSPLDGRTCGPSRLLVQAGTTIAQMQAVAIVTLRTGETEANARLIAAAPDLLDLLQRAVRFCPVDVQNKMYAVIAKAEGAA